MEKDKSIIIQKQVRDNAQDLQKEFLDMKNWEEKMKQADLHLKTSGTDQSQILPPVRKKKSSLRTKLKIKSYDCSAWNNCDADKACEEVDKENESEDSGEEILSKEELEKNHEEATKHKVMGNNYVKEQKWDKAMACYNEAIKIFPYDAVFYANRALCHLKMDNLYSAESDCTSAIQRDEYYVKAYHRRATARMALKQYKEAIRDLKKLLSLESTNKGAQKMLSTALKCLDSSKPVIITSAKDSEIQEKIVEVQKEEKSPIVKEIDKKVLNKSTTIFKENISHNVKQNEKKNTKEKSKAPMNSSKIPDWLPIVDEDVDVVQPIKKLPHQRLNKNPLRSVPIEETNLSQRIIQNLQKMDDLSLESKSKKPLGVEVQQKSVEIEEDKSSENTGAEILLIPRTAVQFFSDWRKFKSPEIRYKYFKQIPPEIIPRIVQDSMESVILSDIIKILKTQFIPNKDGVFHYLKNLSEIKRFTTLAMFFNNENKEDLKVLFDYCKTFECHSDESINKFRHKYEI